MPTFALMVKGRRTGSYSSGDGNLQYACERVFHGCKYQGLLNGVLGMIRTGDNIHVLDVGFYYGRIPDAERWLLCIFDETLELSAA